MIVAVKRANVHTSLLWLHIGMAKRCKAVPLDTNYADSV